MIIDNFGFGKRISDYTLDVTHIQRGLDLYDEVVPSKVVGKFNVLSLDLSDSKSGHLKDCDLPVPAGDNIKIELPEFGLKEVSVPQGANKPFGLFLCCLPDSWIATVNSVGPFLLRVHVVFHGLIRMSLSPIPRVLLSTLSQVVSGFRRQLLAPAAMAVALALSKLRVRRSALASVSALVLTIFIEVFTQHGPIIP